MSTPGARARRRGAILEGIVTSSLVPYGFEVLPYQQWKKHPGRYGDELLLKHVPYTTIYGTTGRTEFVLKSKRFDLEVRIECKWQQGGGSVDEKLPYTFLSCVEAAPEDFVIILIGGGGFRTGAVEWLREAAETRKYVPDDRPEKRVEIMDPTEFITWVNHTFA